VNLNVNLQSLVRALQDTLCLGTSLRLVCGGCQAISCSHTSRS